MQTSTIKPIGDRILVKIDETPKMFKGIHVVSDGVSLTGDVISTGRGWLTRDGIEVPLRVKVGDKVIFIADTGHPVESGEKGFIMFREHDLIAVIEGDEEEGQKSVSEINKSKKNLYKGSPIV